MIVGILLAVLGIALTLVGALAWAGKLPGNSVVGLKVPEVRKSEEVWVTSHKMAGPLWTIGGVALIMGGLIAFRASGWGWVLPVLAVVAALVLLSMGANMGARAASLLHTEEGGCDSDSCNCGSGSCGTSEVDTPEVDVDAVRRAAQDADS